MKNLNKAEMQKYFGIELPDLDIQDKTESLFSDGSDYVLHKDSDGRVWNERIIQSWYGEFIPNENQYVMFLLEYECLEDERYLAIFSIDNQVTEYELEN